MSPICVQYQSCVVEKNLKTFDLFCQIHQESDVYAFLGESVAYWPGQPDLIKV